MERMHDAIDNIWPLTIVSDRYDGTYSWGKYTAWNLEAHDVPQEICLDDSICAAFWKNCDRSKIGIGDSVDDALFDLISKLNGIWISVEDRLPILRKCEDCLVSDDVLVFHDAASSYYGVPYSVGFFQKYVTGDSEPRWCDVLEGATLFGVTHWMPLPGPPK